MKILLICSGGMSSSLLEKNLRLAISKTKDPYTVASCASFEVEEIIQKADLVLVAPQLTHLVTTYNKQYPQLTIRTIPKNVYGTQDGDDLLSFIKDNSEENEETKEFGFISRISSFLVNNSVFSSITESMVSLTPVTLIGSVFTLLRNFSLNMPNLEKFSNLMGLGFESTSGLISLYLTIILSKTYGKKRNIKSNVAIFNGLSVFLLLIKMHDQPVLNADYLGANGMFISIISSIIGVKTYIFIFNKYKFFASSFSRKFNRKIMGAYEDWISVIPVLLNICLFLTIQASISIFFKRNLPELIYISFQNSLSSFIGNNFPSFIILYSIMSILWFFGIHGGSVINTITNPIYYSLSIQNMIAYEKGYTIPYIVSSEFKYIFTFGGNGSTLPLIVVMLIFAKSKQLKVLAKLSLPLGIFFINETIIFGLPIVLNFELLLPFVLIPFISATLTFVLIRINILPRIISISIPWTTPPFLNGFIQGGFIITLWQIILFFFQAILWYPFIVKYDKKILDQESQ